MKYTDEIEQLCLDGITDFIVEPLKTLSKSEKVVFESAGERLSINHQEKKRLSKEYVDKHKLSEKSHSIKYQKASTSKEEFVKKSKENSYFISLAAFPGGFGSNKNLFAFKNDGGIFNGGVCWWHSRLQRAAFYLTTYNPTEPKCSKKEAKKIIRNLIKGNKVSEVNGFTNFYGFSREYQDVIQRYLNLWQLTDGILFWQWINGLSGCYNTTPAKLKKYMDEIYEEVAIKNRIAYVKLQIKGLDSHALLITAITPLGDNQGYIFSYIDSNCPAEIKAYTYINGDTQLKLMNGSVPYLQREGDIDKYLIAINKYSTGK